MRHAVLPGRRAVPNVVFRRHITQIGA